MTALLAVLLGWLVSAESVSAEPTTAYIRLYLNDILKFDPASGFTADIFLGVACQDVCGDPQLVVENGRATATQLLLDTPNIRGYRMELALTDKIDLRQYPFDTHRLSIVFLSARPGDEFQFDVEREATRVGDIHLQGWSVDPRVDVDARVIDDQFTGRRVPTFSFAVTVSRPWLAGMLKVILPGFAILLVGSLGLIVGPEERMKRFDLFNAAFLGTVLFQLNVLSSLPPLSYLTFADRFLLINLFSIIIGVASSVWIILAFRAGRKAHSWSIHEWSMLQIPIIWVAAQTVNVLEIFALKADDPRLWAIAGAELLMGAAILVWHWRRSTLEHRFREAYRRVLEQTRAPDQALTQAIDTFASEPPLSSLTRAELTVLGEVFGSLRDPTVIVDVLIGVLKDGDVSMLKNKEALSQFAAYVTRRYEEATVPPAGAEARPAST